MRTTFAVGRLNSEGAEIVLLEEEGRPTFPGPWTLRAVVRERSSRAQVAVDRSHDGLGAGRDEGPEAGRQETGRTVH